MGRSGTWFGRLGWIGAAARDGVGRRGTEWGEVGGVEWAMWRGRFGVGLSDAEWSKVRWYGLSGMEGVVAGLDRVGVWNREGEIVTVSEG